jgi:uncharacterized protein with PQ loop repeat
MTDPEIIGYIGCFFLCISFIPQTYALCRDNEKKKNLSPTFVMLVLLASLCMGVYAIQLKAYPVLIANCSVFLNNIILMFLYIRNHQ